MMAFLAAYRAVLSVEDYALANVDLHVALGRRSALARSVAKWALRICYLDCALAGAYRAVFCLHHTRYDAYTPI